MQEWWSSYLADSQNLANAKGTELVGAVVEFLEAPIRDGRLSRGDPLPPERALAAEMRISRATVREALHELELKGLVERYQGSGTLVADVQRGALTRSLVRRLSVRDRGLIEIMDFRDATEVPVAARAARYATEAEIARLEATVQRMENEISAERFAGLDDRFHQLLAQATHNLLLVRIVQLGSDWTRSARSPILEDSKRRLVSLEGHRQILACVRGRDPEGAAAAMNAHLQAVLEEMLSAVAVSGVEPGSE